MQIGEKVQIICICQKKAVPLQPQRLLKNTNDMKKYLIIGIIALCAGCLTGCNDKDNDPKLASMTLDMTVLHNDWSFDQETLQFYYRFKLPEITAHVYNYGNWTISREYNKGYSEAYQVALPMSVFGHDTISNGNVIYYTRHIDYRVGVGYVDIQVTDSDFPYPVNPSTGKRIVDDFIPEDMFFRMQIIE